MTYYHYNENLSGKFTPSAEERLQQAYGKTFSSFDELKSLGAPLGLQYANYNLGQVNERPIVQTNPGYLADRYLTVSGIDSNLINGQTKVNDRLVGLGNYVLDNAYIHEFIPSIRVQKLN